MNRGVLFATLWFLTAACDAGSSRSPNENPDGDGGGDAGGDVGGDAGGQRSSGGNLGDRPGQEPHSDAPPVIDTHPSCVLSADCPAGQYCDLGECIQECNTAHSCESGKVCSPRARCIAPSESDRDPPPSVRREGTISATPSSAVLTERDDVLSITLESDSEESVRYRVELNAPHLSVESPRGEFVGKTTLRLPVDSARRAGAETSGTVRFITTLGDVTVTAPLRTGVTGAYEGTMTYDGSAVPLGSAVVALSLREEDGKVAARIDPDRSLLFPAMAGKAATGQGVFRRADGAQFSVTYDVPAELGGDRNRFRRPMQRTVAFRLLPDERGNLAGTFEERISGLLARTVTLEGTVHLRRQSLPLQADFEPAEIAAPLETVAGKLKLADVFPGWDESNCVSILNPPTEFGESCEPRPDGSLPGGCAGSLHLFAMMAHNTYYLLEQRLEAGGLESISSIASACAADLQHRPSEESNPVACASIPRLACALSNVVDSAAHSSGVSAAFGALFAHVLEPALFVAQEEIVQGVKSSFTDGSAGERKHLVRAGEILGPPATWVLQARVMDYLARLPMLGASADSVDSIRKLGRLFFVQSTLDGELARLETLAATPRGVRLPRAQERAVLTFLEAAAITGVLDRWGRSAPPDLGVELTDVLSPADAGFRSLLQGELVFGVREGFVPMMNQKGDESSNSTQVLAAARPSLEQFVADEKAFTASNRDYETNDGAFNEQVVRIQTEFETNIANICGSSLNIEQVDWAKCGASGGGQVGGLLLDIELARARLDAAEQRMTGLGQKIVIELRRIEDVKKIRSSTIEFVGKNGEKRVDLAIREGAINVALKAIEVASQASVLNFGAPFAESVLAGVLEAERAHIEVDRIRLETAKEMQIRADDAEVEARNGMAVVQSMYIDMAQLAVEVRQELIGVLQAQQSAGEGVERARRLYSDRAKMIVHAGSSPLRDPSFRVLQDGAALHAIRSRAETQRWLYLATRALEYELNQPLGETGARAVFSVHNAAQASRLENCLRTIATKAVIANGQPQNYVTELSVRKLLGVSGERTDSVTGEVLTPGDQFRRILLRNENLDGHGGVGVAFASSAHPGNGLWPVNVCDDKIISVAAQVVGDFSGNDDAQIEVALEGGGVLRRCDENALVNWSTSGLAVTQAGVNSYGAAAPNRSLKGLSVASSRFKLTLPGAEIAPANADLNLRNIDDIVLRIEHEARTVNQNPTGIDLGCLSEVGSAP